ncbi:MAG: C40 family peptidase [Acidimicrobiales bacterium]
MGRLSGRRVGRRTLGAVWATIAAVALVGTLLSADPGGWPHHHARSVTLRSSAGAVITASDAVSSASSGSSPGPMTKKSKGRRPSGPVSTSAPSVRAPGVAPKGALRHLPPLPKPTGALPPVAGLSTTRSVDAIVTLPTTVTPAEVAALVKLQGLSAVEEVDTGTVSVAGAPAVTLGVDPGTFRQFTPKVTASEDNLWRYIAGGVLASSYEMAADRSLPLGQSTAIKPAGGGLAPTTGWLGALASLGLPGVDMIVSHAYSDRLGLTPDSGLVVSASKMDPFALSAALMSTLPGASVELLHPNADMGSATSPALPAGVLGKAVSAALTRVGDPYAWGGTGPGTFDCSGLVQWSFAQAGISLPRTAAEQYLTGPRLALADAQPGDLLFWAYDPNDPSFVDHTAIYLGNGMMAVAPHTGLDVQVAPVPTVDFSGAVRVDPASAGTSGGPGTGPGLHPS